MFICHLNVSLQDDKHNRLLFTANSLVSRTMLRSCPVNDRGRENGRKGKKGGWMDEHHPAELGPKKIERRPSWLVGWFDRGSL